MRAICVPGLLDGRRAVDAEDARARRSWSAKPAIIPACVEPVTEQTTIVSKKTPSSRSCSATSPAQRAKPSPPSGWSDAPAGIGYGLPPASSTEASASSQLGRMPMSKPGRVEADVGAHDAREQDVADLVVDDVGPLDPALLDEHAAEPEARGDGRHLARVVRLHAADRDERVAALRERVGGEVLQLAHLVPAVGEPGAARPPASPRSSTSPPRCSLEPLEPVHRRGAELERHAVEAREAHVRRGPSPSPRARRRRRPRRSPPARRA